MSITDKQLKAIVRYDTYTGPSELSDGEGFIARVSPKARITFQYRCRFNGKNQRFKIGKYPIVSLKEARQIHKRMLEHKEAGRSPEIALTCETEFITLDDCLNYWFENKVSTLKEGTQVLYKSVADNHFYGEFPGINVASITAREWVVWLDKIAEKNPKVANSAFARMRACLNFCKSKFLIEGTHLDKIRQQDIGAPSDVGDRVLTWSELAKIWIAIERSQAATSTKNLHLITLLWGNRISELRLARREHFDMKAGIWTVPAELSKTKKPIRRPIPDKVRPILEREMQVYDDVLFPGAKLDIPLSIASANRYIRRLRAGIDIPTWRTHDFRRSISTGASELGVMPHVVEKMLGHELGGVLAIYNKHDWLDEQLVAYNLYADSVVKSVDALFDGERK